jgi:hypothetical protein
MGFTVKSYICVKSKEINQLKVLGSGSVITRPGWCTVGKLAYHCTGIEHSSLRKSLLQQVEKSQSLLFVDNDVSRISLW